MPNESETDPRLAISLSGVKDEASAWGGVRGALDGVASLGVRGVVLDATAPETRPRELDRSARRDLVASMRRRGLGCLGIDLWIPPEHFVSPAHVDRAMAAVSASAILAREMCEGAGRVVSIATGPQAEADLLRSIRSIGTDAGVRIADHRVASDGHAREDTRIEDGPDEGLDCAGVLLVGADPALVLARRADRIASVRLGDVGSMGRVAVGTGRLDVPALAAAAGTLWRAGPVVIDLRGTPDARQAGKGAVGAWERARRLE